MEHIPREISPYLYFLLKKKYKASPIPSGGLEVPLSLTFSCKEKWIIDTMEEFIQNFYTFEYSGNQSVDTNDSEDEEQDDY